MNPIRYAVITLDDAKTIAAALLLLTNGPTVDPSVTADPSLLMTILTIQERLRAETGADMQEIVDELRKMRICAACSGEGVASDCGVIDAQKQGRRLRRLLERARDNRAVKEERAR